MLTPNVPAPKTESGGDRTNRDLQALWDRREPAPFYYSPEADICADIPCVVCEAPLHRYEVEVHEEACKRILGSDGKDRPFPKATKEPDEEQRSLLC